MVSGVAVALPSLGAELNAGATALSLVETLFLAAADRSALPLVRDACCAAAERSAELLLPAARCAWPDRERFEADPRGSRFSARLVAALRRALVRLELPSPWPRS